MIKGYSTQLTRQIGEHLVVAKLGRLGILATPFAGNVPDYDLLASDLSGYSLPLQVKAINGPSWQFSVTSFLEIKFEGERQIVKGKKEIFNPNLICVFVFLKSDGNDEFYVLTVKVLQEHFLKNYKGGIRPRNPKSTHCAIWPKELTKYRDNWKLITEHFNPLK
ncbi:MAG: hypothetical protein HY756_11305 [Nitrospirae bacterium]|nr:hypothetical protein [Nitrospirota bacterium]